MDEKIPPFYVKRFEYPEKRYINVRNDYYYYYYSVFVCIHAPVLLGLLFPAFGWTSHWTFASTSQEVTLGYLELLLLPYSEIIIHCFFTRYWIFDYVTNIFDIFLGLKVSEVDTKCIYLQFPYSFMLESNSKI